MDSKEGNDNQKSNDLNGQFKCTQQCFKWAVIAALHQKESGNKPEYIYDSG